MAAAAPGSGGAPSWSPPHELVSQTVTLLLVLRDPTNPQVRLLFDRSGPRTFWEGRHGHVRVAAKLKPYSDAFGLIRHAFKNNPQYGEAQRHLEAHQEEPSFLLALAYVLAQTTPDQACVYVMYVCLKLCKWRQVMHAFLHILNPSVLYHHQQVPDDVRQLAGLLLKNHVLRHAQPFVLGEIRGGGGGGAVQQGAELRDYVKHQVRFVE